LEFIGHVDQQEQEHFHQEDLENFKSKKSCKSSQNPVHLLLSQFVNEKKDTETNSKEHDDTYELE